LLKVILANTKLVVSIKMQNNFLKIRKPALTRRGRLKIENSPQSQVGFTFIELLVVLSLLITITFISGSIFFSTFRSSSKTQVSTNLKQKGDYALTTMEKMIREAKEIDCISDKEIELVYKDGQTTTFSCLSLSDQIASDSANSAVLLTPINCSDFSFICDLPRVDISFELNQNPDDPLPFKRSVVDFQTSVTARNL
jgi:type II secretory pathway pseudopilin PulG